MRKGLKFVTLFTALTLITSLVVTGQSVTNKKTLTISSTDGVFDRL